jgi:hypothetical protein
LGLFRFLFKKRETIDIRKNNGAKEEPCGNSSLINAGKGVCSNVVTYVLKLFVYYFKATESFILYNYSVCPRFDKYFS